MHKLYNAECIINLDFRYAYNHFDCLILFYKPSKASHRMDLFVYLQF